MRTEMPENHPYITAKFLAVLYRIFDSIYQGPIPCDLDIVKWILRPRTSFLEILSLVIRETRKRINGFELDHIYASILWRVSFNFPFQPVV